MKIQLILVGKNKEKWLEEGVDDFLKKLLPYTEIKIEYLKEEKIAKSFSLEQIKTMEGKKILQTVNGGNFLIVLDERGKNLSSLELADLMQQKINFGQNLTFVVGGALGLAKEVIQKANFVLSFSQFTLTHQMIRLFLLEQIYRGLNILKGTGYHKD